MWSKVLRLLIPIAYKIAYGAEVPTTSRGIKSYQRSLFPDCGTPAGMLQYLQGKVVVDVGSGLTHKNPDSLLNKARRSGQAIEMFGIEPRTGYRVGHSRGFSRRDLLIEKILGWVRRTRESSQRLCGEHYVMAAYAHALPFAEGSVDCILSDNCVPWWIHSADDLLQILEEFARVLRVGGEIRLSPVAAYQETILRGQVSTFEVHTLKRVNLPRFSRVFHPSLSKEVAAMLLVKKSL